MLPPTGEEEQFKEMCFQGLTTWTECGKACLLPVNRSPRNPASFPSQSDG